MQEQAGDAYAFIAVMFLPVLVWIVSRPPLWARIRPRLQPVAARLWQQLLQPEPPDLEVLCRWAAIRLQQLQGHLERVRRLILDDEWMTATRQVANRMAHERLLRDVREAEDTLTELDPFGALTGAASPAFAASSRLAFSAAPPQRVVEVIEFGPSGRWL